MLATKFISCHISQFDSRKEERGKGKICLRHKIFDIACHVLHKIASWTAIMGYCSEVPRIHTTEGIAIALTNDMFDKIFFSFFFHFSSRWTILQRVCNRRYNRSTTIFIVPSLGEFDAIPVISNGNSLIVKEHTYYISCKENYFKPQDIERFKYWSRRNVYGLDLSNYFNQSN